MPTAPLLPLRFLLPSWSSRQIRRLVRAYNADYTSGKPAQCPPACQRRGISHTSARDETWHEDRSGVGGPLGRGKRSLPNRAPANGEAQPVKQLLNGSRPGKTVRRYTHHKSKASRKANTRAQDILEDSEDVQAVDLRLIDEEEHKNGSYLEFSRAAGDHFREGQGSSFEKPGRNGNTNIQGTALGHRKGTTQKAGGPHSKAPSWGVRQPRQSTRVPVTNSAEGTPADERAGSLYQQARPSFDDEQGMVDIENSPTGVEIPAKSLHDELFPAGPVAKPQRQGAADIDPEPVVEGSKTSLTSDGQSTASPLSLFEELFPTESRRDRVRQTQPEKPGPLEDLHFPDLDIPSSSKKSLSPNTRRPSATQIHKLKKWNPSGLTVLAIHGLSPNLSLSDFERIIPRGEHIEAWRSPGDVLYAIPGRNRSTLSSTGMYFLVFGKVSMARAYKAQLHHMHAIAKEYTPTSLLSKSIPGAGYYIRGDNIYQIIQDHTLCPPSQELKVKMTVIPDKHETLKHLLQHQGYEVFENTSHNPKSGRSVVVWIEGHAAAKSVPVPELIRLDGKQRGQAWGALRPEGDIVPLGVSKRAMVAYRRMLSQKKRIEGASGLHTDAEPDANPGADSSSSESSLLPGEKPEMDVDVDVEENELDRAGLAELEEATSLAETLLGPGKRNSGAPQRWLVSFTHETEARRFVRRWHRRPVPGFADSNVRAEFTW